MRVWRLPPQCLDNRRLLAQHAEVHIAITCAGKVVDGAPYNGWANPNNNQLRQWIGKRGALFQYHNDIILPECRRRWPSSAKFRDHELLVHGSLPENERHHEFWPNVTWDQVLLDCRHLIEKHNNDKDIVRLAHEHGQRTRVTIPKGHDGKAILFTFWRAISHTHGIPLTDSEHIQRVAIRLTRERLLDPPTLKIAA